MLTAQPASPFASRPLSRNPGLPSARPSPVHIPLDDEAQAWERQLEDRELKLSSERLEKRKEVQRFMLAFDRGEVLFDSNYLNALPEAGPVSSSSPAVAVTAI